MEIKPGYKQTEVGVIPQDWSFGYVENMAHITTGSRNTQDRVEDGEYPFFVRSQNVERINSYSFDGEAVLTAGDGVGTGKVYHYINGKFDVHQRVYRISHFSEALNGYFFYLYFSTHFYNRIMQMTAKSSVDSVRREMIARMPVPLPPTETEQCAIAEALSDVDVLLGGLDRLISKKRDLQQAAKQQLLTGQTRLPGFRGEWRVKRIAEIATQTTERNSSGKNLPVLTCSKHTGFLDSLGFFKNQVFSRDLSSYKVNRYGEIGYPANHIEEGSIGLQDLYDLAAVSPIYVTLRADQSIDSYFLHRLLKLDSYRQLFKAATTSSIDRRGSLRWPTFSQIKVRLPPTRFEQTAITEVLIDMDAEIAVLEQRREKTRALKQGMMQELLTGKTRLI
jgi:type I restriction enzyme S subunit